jgi:adenosylcobinamide-phosphate synthase
LINIILPAAVILDLLMGDPKFYTHPVVLIGKLIKFLEKKLNKSSNHRAMQRMKGVILVITVLLVTFVITYLVIFISNTLNYYLGVIIKILILYTTLAIKGLSKAALEIFNQLSEGDLKGARHSLNWIVGRDTDDMKENEIIRGTIETVAENTSDGIIAPLFYFFLAGPIGAVLYKAVNTMDSMLGYRNEKYKYFGWASARLDDVANYIPARLTAILIVFSSFVYRKDYKRAFKTLIRDAKKHVSPNAGYPESALAGALRIQLGGINYYFGNESKKALLGDKIVDFKVKNIKETINLMIIATFSFILIMMIMINLIS